MNKHHCISDFCAITPTGITPLGVDHETDIGEIVAVQSGLLGSKIIGVVTTKSACFHFGSKEVVITDTEEQEEYISLEFGELRPCTFGVFETEEEFKAEFLEVYEIHAEAEDFASIGNHYFVGVSKSPSWHSDKEAGE